MAAGPPACEFSFSERLIDMKSPFPGMDPYLEAYWGDVHQRLVMYLSDAIQVNLPVDLRSRVEERVFDEADLS